MVAISITKNTISYENSYKLEGGGPIAPEDVGQSVVVGKSSYISNPGNPTIKRKITNDALVVGLLDPLMNLVEKDGFRVYKVKKGDTLGGIADKFNITINTIKSANPNLKKFLSVGQKLIILPVQGALYSVSKDDTIESISLKYNVDKNLIKTYNPSYQNILATTKGFLVLPYVKPSAVKIRKNKKEKLPYIKNYFSLPAVGWNWGQLHDYNAVDIANKCGTEVVASADGIVISDKNFGDGSSGWNGGYGIFILIEHPNGTKTRYAHLSKALTKTGTPVLRGEKIGIMGNTGNTHGPTGCHLHFEVSGARNPFVLK